MHRRGRTYFGHTFQLPGNRDPRASGYRATRLLKALTVYSDPKEGNSTVSLIDSPPGCLVIRRFVEFGWKPPR
jgi:hypothetical protein